MQLYTDLKNSAAEAEALAVEQRHRVDQLRERRAILAADAERESASLDIAIQEAAIVRAEQAAARAEGRAAPKGKAPDVASMREGLQTTQDAVAVLDKQIAELEPACARAESEARVAMSRKEMFERGGWMIEMALVVGEIFKRNAGGVEHHGPSRLFSAFKKALQSDDPNKVKQQLIHAGLEAAFGFQSPESAAAHEFMGLVDLPPALGLALPVRGQPSEATLQALAIAPRNVVSRMTEEEPSQRPTIGVFDGAAHGRRAAGRG